MGFRTIPKKIASKCMKSDPKFIVFIEINDKISVYYRYDKELENFVMREEGKEWTLPSSRDFLWENLNYIFYIYYDINNTYKNFLKLFSHTLSEDEDYIISYLLHRIEALQDELRYRI